MEILGNSAPSWRMKGNGKHDEECHGSTRNFFPDCSRQGSDQLPAQIIPKMTLFRPSSVRFYHLQGLSHSAESYL
ncbi:hypothetical protein JHK82_024794 [Glycine max]|nr:hypothetical protein JHK86_024909 [Glycine max]KAG5133606.1 hypothetical protein JHK82_024794 [Glycine max]